MFMCIFLHAKSNPAICLETHIGLFLAILSFVRVTKLTGHKTNNSFGNRSNVLCFSVNEFVQVIS